jgi:hypothetical protein
MKLHKLILIAAAALVMYSCVPFPIVMGGAAGGAVYSTTNDSVSDVFTMSKEQAFEAMIGILNRENAQITLSSIADGKIEARTNTSVIYINITPFNAESIKVAINAKKHIELVPDKDTAVRIFRLFIKETIR